MDNNEFTELELFKKASQIDKGNIYARRKLAYLEYDKESYLSAAL
jgi:hypothetical protein